MKLSRIAPSILLVIIFTANAFCNDDTTAYTQSGDEVALKKNGTWSYRAKEKTAGGKVVKIGVTYIEQRGEYCAIKYEIQNTTPINFKSFWPYTHLVDKKGLRFASDNIQIAIRPNQSSVTEVTYYRATCLDLAKIEMDSFSRCDVYGTDNKEKQLGDCETLIAPLPGTRVPIIVIKTKT